MELLAVIVGSLLILSAVTGFLLDRWFHPRCPFCGDRKRTYLHGFLGDAECDVHGMFEEATGLATTR